MRRLASDLRYAARSLAKAPLFASIAVLSLGLALALNTTMFALVDAVEHPYVPYPDADRLVLPRFDGGDRKNPVSSEDVLRAIRDGMHGYDRIAMYRTFPALVETDATAEDLWPVAVSPEFFDVLGVRPLLGRTITAADDATNHSQTAVISYGTWNRLFGGRPLSDTLRLDIAGTRYTVIGVMPRGVRFPFETDIWIPLATGPGDAGGRFGVRPILRLKSGVSMDAARVELDQVGKRLTAQFAQKRPFSAWLVPIGLTIWGRVPFSPFVFGAVVMVLVIACANLATMMIARGIARRRVTAIRVALGASRREIARGVLIECGLVVLAGTTLGMLLTIWTLYILPHSTVPWVATIGDLQAVPSWRVFAFALLAAMATVGAAGLVPAMRAASVDPAEPMKEAAGTTTGRVRDRYNPLIILEVALSTALLMCSALFVLIVVRLSAFEFHYAAQRLVTADVTMQATRLPHGISMARFYHDLVEREQRLSGATSAATIRNAAPDGGIVIAEEGKTGDTWMNVSGYSVVSPGFLQTLGIPILSGRDFAPGDANGQAPVAIVDAEAAVRLWPDMPSPLGRMLKLGGKMSRAPWVRVVGVTPFIEYQPRKDPDLPAEPIIYVVVPNDSAFFQRLVVRATNETDARGRERLAVRLRHDLQVVMPLAGATPVRPWLQEYEGRRQTERFMASLFGAFAGFGLVLCAVGLYGVLAYTAGRREREFAVRIALGARAWDVARLVVHDAAVTALGGVGIGAFVALWVSRSVTTSFESLPFAEVRALIVAEAILFLVAIVAALGPVRHAAKADPVEVLRAI